MNGMFAPRLLWQADRMRGAIFLFAFVATALSPLSSLGGGRAGAQAESGFSAYVAGLGRKAISQGVSQRTVDAIIPTLNYNTRVVELDRAQPGSNPSVIPNFAPYRAQHVDAARITRGRTKYAINRPLLSRVERETGVPEGIMVSIWGNETNYGAFTGNFDLPQSLASLAYEGRRRTLFEEEFIASLKIIDRGIPREAIRGSWAGATGYPQFLPSMYLRLARDGDGDGRVDIWRSEADALASIANYFVAAGWRPDQPWGVAVRVPSSLDRARIVNRTSSPRCPRVHARHSRWMTVAEWRALGVSPIGRSLPDSTLASLLEPDGAGATAYLLTGNYRVILDYNCSNFYALSVGLLADAVAS
jgi:membrane-bound lytic murein transglycosylase B